MLFTAVVSITNRPEVGRYAFVGNSQGSAILAAFDYLKKAGYCNPSEYTVMAGELRHSVELITPVVNFTLKTL